MSFLSPIGALVALVCLLTLAALLQRRAKGRRTRSVIGLPAARFRSYVVPLAAVVFAAVFLGGAAAQPVVEFEETGRVRTDAELFIVLDTSRSMLARSDPGADTRIVRSKSAALELREALVTVPVGLASLTDRALPHLFPSVQEDAFRETLARSIGIERPPPLGSFLSRVTKLEAISAFATRGYYSPKARVRVLVVLTDGETLPWTARLDLLFRSPPIQTVFVHVWRSDERVFAGAVPEPGYRSDPEARDTLDRFSASVGGTVFSEGDLGAVKQSVRRAVGDGPTVTQGVRNRHIAVAPYLAAAAFFPLVLVLWRRDR